MSHGAVSFRSSGPHRSETDRSRRGHDDIDGQADCSLIHSHSVGRGRILASTWSRRVGVKERVEAMVQTGVKTCVRHEARVGELLQRTMTVNTSSSHETYGDTVRGHKLD